MTITIDEIEDEKKVQDAIIKYRQSEIGKKRLKEYQKYKEDLEHKKRVQLEKNMLVRKNYVKSKEYKLIYKKYQKSEKGKISRLRSDNKRKRSLGFIPLNLGFEGSEAHHLDKNKVLYIPIELHKSVCHNVQTGKNMIKINEKCFEWFKSQFNN